MSDQPVSLPQAILSCRCPRCGRGKLFKWLLAVSDTCSICGLDLRRGDTGDAGAVPIIIFLGAIVGGLFLQFCPDLTAGLGKGLSNLLYAGLLIAAIVAMPTGAVGAWRRLTRPSAAQ